MIDRFMPFLNNPAKYPSLHSILAKCLIPIALVNLCPHLIPVSFVNPQISNVDIFCLSLIASFCVLSGWALSFLLKSNWNLLFSTLMKIFSTISCAISFCVFLQAKNYHFNFMKMGGFILFLAISIGATMVIWELYKNKNEIPNKQGSVSKPSDHIDIELKEFQDFCYIKPYERELGKGSTVFFRDTKIRKDNMTLAMFQCASLGQPQIVRCHRSFIVNLAEIVEVSKGTRDVLLMMSNGDKIPVARDNSNEITGIVMLRQLFEDYKTVHLPK